jgi:hypothetical protein
MVVVVNCDRCGKFMYETLIGKKINYRFKIGNLEYDLCDECEKHFNNYVLSCIKIQENKNV